MADEHERERIERLVREGKVSDEEGRKLVDAIDNAERREASATAEGGSAGEHLALDVPDEREKSPGIFSRPAARLLAGLALILVGATVQSFLMKRVTRSLGETVDAGSISEISDQLSEIASGLATSWAWSLPFYVPGVLLVIASIFKLVVRAVVREARKV